MTQLIKRVSLVCALVAIFSGLTAASAQAGQLRSPIPSRVKKAEKGDWALIRFEDRMMLEAVTDTEEVEDDFLIHYTMQTISLAGKAEAPKNVVRLLSDEANEYAELVGTRGAKADRKKAKVEGKTINVVVVTVPEEDGTIEHWFSDEVGVDGRVAMIVKFPEMEAYKALEVIGFGDAKTPFNLAKYLK